MGFPSLIPLFFQVVARSPSYPQLKRTEMGSLKQLRIRKLIPCSGKAAPGAVVPLQGKREAGKSHSQWISISLWGAPWLRAAPETPTGSVSARAGQGGIPQAPVDAQIPGVSNWIHLETINNKFPVISAASNPGGFLQNYFPIKLSLTQLTSFPAFSLLILSPSC